MKALLVQQGEQLVQKDEQLAHLDEQLATQASQLAKNAATIAEQAARIAALEAAAAAAPTAPALRRTMTEEENAKQALKCEHERKFNNQLEPLLRTWMGEAPTTADAALLADKDRVLALEQALHTPAGRSELAELLPAIVARLCATAQSYMSEEQVKRLLAIIKAGNKLYFGIYHGVLDMVRSNDRYGDFCSALDAVVVDESRFPQRTPGLLAIYDAAREALPLFGAVLADVVVRAKGRSVGVETRAAPLKHVFRVLQKHATRVDGGEPTEFETACDIVRGSIVCDSMGDLLVVLELLLALQEEGTILIVRTKNRFERPTAAGWADAMLNFVCPGGSGAAGEHVCELQLVHATMLKARKEFGGHSAYAAFREAAELLDFVVGGALFEAPVAALEAATAVARRGGEERAAFRTAWLAAWCAAQTALVPLRRSRSLVSDGSEAAVCADALLGRVAHAGWFSETGGEAQCVQIAGDGMTRVSCMSDTSNYAKYAHAGTGQLGSFSVGIKLGSKMTGGFSFGLAAADKDLSKDGHILADKHTWLISGHGYLYADGKPRRIEGLHPGEELDLEYDAEAKTLQFLRAGMLLGEHTGVVAPVKLVVSVRVVGHGLELL